MKTSSQLLKTAGFAIAAPLLATAATAQDECSMAAPLMFGVPTAFDNTTATNNPMDPAFDCGGTAANALDVWFTFTGTIDGQYVVSTDGSAFDTRLEIFEGTCGALVFIDCDDDGGPGTTSEVTFSGLGGATYYARAAGFSGAFGAGTITATAPPFPDECADAFALELDLPQAFDTTLATHSAMAPAFGCGGDPALALDLWYTYTAAVDAMVDFETCGSSFDTRLEVYTGDCMTLVSAGCNDDSCGTQSVVSLMTTMGTTYYVRVAGFNGAAGEGEVLVRGPAPVVVNDNCIGALPILNGVTEMWDNTMATTSPGAPFSCGGAPGSDLWYTFTPFVDGPIMIDTEGTLAPTDTRLEVYEGSCGNLTSIDCDDDGGTGLLSMTSFMGTGGTAYYIRVAGFSGATGDMGMLTATYLDSFPNDDCSGALPVMTGVTNYTNVGATDSMVPMSCGVFGSVGSEADLWYTWTASVNGNVIIDTLGSDIDSTIAVFTGDCMTLTEVACDDDFYGGGPAGFTSQVNFVATAGTTYIIQAGSWNGDEGANGILNITEDVDSGIADLFCGGLPNSTGVPGLLTASGSLVATDMNLSLNVTNAPAGVTGLVATTNVAPTTLVNTLGGGTGTLCIANFDLARFPVMATDAMGEATQVVDTMSIPTNAGLVPAMMGDVFYFQFWHRDMVGGMMTSNLTSAISVTFQ